MNWNALTDEKQLEQLEKESHDSPVLIFKHSTRCGISRMVLKNYEKAINNTDTNSKYYFLDLLKYRSVSNAIEQRWSVVHESPQLIKLSNGKVENHASHYSIIA